MSLKRSTTRQRTKGRPFFFFIIDTVLSLSFLPLAARAPRRRHRQSAPRAWRWPRRTRRRRWWQQEQEEEEQHRCPLRSLPPSSSSSFSSFSLSLFLSRLSRPRQRGFWRPLSGCLSLSLSRAMKERERERGGSRREEENRRKTEEAKKSEESNAVHLLHFSPPLPVELAHSLARRRKKSARILSPFRGFPPLVDSSIPHPLPLVPPFSPLRGKGVPERGGGACRQHRISRKSIADDDAQPEKNDLFPRPRRARRGAAGRVDGQGAPALSSGQGSAVVRAAGLPWRGLRGGLLQRRRRRRRWKHRRWWPVPRQQAALDRAAQCDVGLR